MLYGVTAIGFIAGSQASPLLLHRFGLSAVLRWATRAAAAAALAMAALATAGGLGLLSVLLPALAFTACLGFIQPLATVGALSGHAAHAGSASALMGTVQFLLAAVSGSAVGFFTDGTARPMALLMLLGTGSAVLLDLSRGRVRAAPI
jgi:DHA1 family bicyclomycin/chloramphenicol resistance-like MFS transporter